jgi:hypothetical protein
MLTFSFNVFLLSKHPSCVHEMPNTCYVRVQDTAAADTAEGTADMVAVSTAVDSAADRDGEEVSCAQWIDNRQLTKPVLGSKNLLQASNVHNPSISYIHRTWLGLWAEMGLGSGLLWTSRTSRTSPSM